MFPADSYLFTSFIFLSVNCWPNENNGQCEVSVQYDLQLEELELNDVVISIPVP